MALAAAAFAACVHDVEPAKPPPDAPIIDVSDDTNVPVPPVSVLKDGVDVPANLSCLGMPPPDGGVIAPPDGGGDAADESGADAAPADGGALPIGTLVEKEVELIGFGTGGADKLANQTVDVFYSNSSFATPDLTVTSDDKGLVRVPLPEGVRVAYHVRASTLLGDYYGHDDLHVPLPPATNIRWQGVTRERQEFLSLAITGDKNAKTPPGAGIVAGRIMDCDRRYMQYARLELWDYTDSAAGTKLEFVRCGQGLCRSFLSDAELPDVGRNYSSRSSLFAMLDVPVGRKLRVRAFGRVKENEPEIEVAWRELEVHDGAINAQFLEPNAPKSF